MSSVRSLLLITVTLALFSLVPKAHSQNTSEAGIRHGISYFSTPGTRRWDAAQGVMFFGKHWHLEKNVPLQSYNADGTLRGAGIDLYKDFPGLLYPHIADFAAGPNGTTIIAAELMFGPRDGKNSILTYDSEGKLLSVFDTNPYAAEAIAEDDQADIFMLGRRIDERAGDPPYPLLVKYDSSGNIIGNAIESNVFKRGSDAIEDFGQGDELVGASVTLLDGNLFIYEPSEKEVLVCSADGKILRRANLEDIIAKIVRSDKVHHAKIAEVSFVDKDHVVLDVTEHVNAEEPMTIDVRNMRTAAYLLDLTTKGFKVILKSEYMNPAFLGVKGNQLLMLFRGEQGYEVQTHQLPD
jgi:hypothetical protein